MAKHTHTHTAQIQTPHANTHTSWNNCHLTNLAKQGSRVRLNPAVWEDWVCFHQANTSEWSRMMRIIITGLGFIQQHWWHRLSQCFLRGRLVGSNFLFLHLLVSKCHTVLKKLHWLEENVCFLPIVWMYCKSKCKLIAHIKTLSLRERGDWRGDRRPVLTSSGLHQYRGEAGISNRPEKSWKHIGICSYYQWKQNILDGTRKHTTGEQN